MDKPTTSPRNGRIRNEKAAIVTAHKVNKIRNFTLCTINLNTVRFSKLLEAVIIIDNIISKGYNAATYMQPF